MIDVFGNLTICVAALAALIGLIDVATEIEAKWFWILLAIGIGLWFIAESLWAILEVLVGIELPYPSIADFFWLIGFPFIIIAFVKGRGQFFSLSHQLVACVIVSAALVFLILAYILLPIIKSDLDLTEKMLDTAYPLLDSVIFIFALYFFFITYRQLNLDAAKPWLLLSFAFILFIGSDTAFSYFTFQGIYEEWPYYLIDIPYMFAYFFIFLACRAKKQVIYKFSKVIKKQESALRKKGLI